MMSAPAPIPKASRRARHGQGRRRRRCAGASLRDPLLDRACARRTPVLVVGTEKRIAVEQRN